MHVNLPFLLGKGVEENILHISIVRHNPILLQEEGGGGNGQVDREFTRVRGLPFFLSLPP